MGSVVAKQVAEKCLICGYSRVIERCHIYPARIIKRMVHVEGFNKSAKVKSSTKGRHIMLLCPNCHWLYDHFLLNKDEFDKIRQAVLEGLREFHQVLAYYVEKSIIPNDFLERFHLWNNKMSETLEKFYGNSTTN